MKVVVNKEPFTHYDVKDFLTTEDFSVVYNYCLLYTFDAADE